VNYCHHHQWLQSALARYDSALADDPSLIEAWYARGHILCQLDRYEEAIASYNYALTLAPDDDIDDIKDARDWVVCLMQYNSQPMLTPQLATALVQQAIAKLCRHQCVSAVEIIESLQLMGISLVHSSELVTFVPLAFGRVFLQRTEIVFSPHLVWVNPTTHQETVVLLADQILYEAAYNLARQWMKTNTHMDVLLPLASLSSEVEAVTQALNQGLSMKGSQFSSPRACLVQLTRVENSE